MNTTLKMKLSNWLLLSFMGSKLRHENVQQICWRALLGLTPVEREESRASSGRSWLLWSQSYLCGLCWLQTWLDRDYLSKLSTLERSGPPSLSSH